jgi:uncharacterized membrane protein YphA (DoxX/SURF4 family)
MEDSMAHPPLRADALELPLWKSSLALLSAVLLGLLFAVSGIWKITDPLGAATRMTQALVPPVLSLPAAIGFGVAEAAAAVFLFVPRFRRWGALLCGLMLVAFLAYFAVFYNTLRGEDCSCFPWIKRAVGPMFFISDGIMLLMAWAAWRWSRPSEGVRSAAVIAAAVLVFATVSWGVVAAQQTGARAPDVVLVDGKPYSLQQGRFFVYFFDPECSHCFLAAREMGKYSWMDVTVISVPSRLPQFSGQFLTDAGLKSLVSSDYALLKKHFPHGDPPYAVAIEHGRQKAAMRQFDGKEPAAELRKIGFVD